MAFANGDLGRLVGPPGMVDPVVLEKTHGAWGRQLLRAALPMEFLAQLLKRNVKLAFRGGTLLQCRLGFPPLRASVDLDAEARSGDDVKAALGDLVTEFKASGLMMEILPTRTPGFKADITFPLVAPTGYTMRVDVLEVTAWHSQSKPWPLPDPWKAVPSVPAPTLETQAAQKLLLAGPPRFGRLTAGAEGNRGRKSRIKDLFDLRCLANQGLRGERVVAAAKEEVARKNAFLDKQFTMEELVADGTRALAVFAPPRPKVGGDDASSFWRAFSDVRPTIRDPFTELDLRITGGCAHHALGGLGDGGLDWVDSWQPATSGRLRKKWVGVEKPEFVVAPRAGFEPLLGLAEAWMRR